MNGSSAERLRAAEGPLRPICLPVHRPDLARLLLDDRDGALEQLRRIAEAGHSYASAALAHMYLDELIISEDSLSQSRHWLEKAIAQGSSDYAVWIRGWVELEEGRIGNGLASLQEAVDAEFAPAAIDLGSLYFSGQLVPKDLLRSESYFWTAKRNGHAYASWCLQNLYATGRFGWSRLLLTFPLRPLAGLKWRLFRFAKPLSPSTLYRTKSR